MFKVGDKVKYTFDSGKTLYGVIEEINDVCDYKYYVHYNEDGDGMPLSIYDWEQEDDIELIEDDAKFRAFLREVACGDMAKYSEPYDNLYNLVWNYMDEENVNATIDYLCDFYKDFKPTTRKKMTVAEIEKELGYKIEVVK
jgi:hypothetical protein